MNPRPARTFVLLAGLALLVTACMPPPQPPPPQEAPSPIGRSVTNTGSNVREGPGTSFPVLTVLAANTPVDIYGRSGGWREIAIRGGRGWIHSSLLGRRRARPPSEVPPAEPDPEIPVVDASPCAGGQDCPEGEPAGIEVTPEG